MRRCALLLVLAGSVACSDRPADGVPVATSEETGPSRALAEVPTEAELAALDFDGLLSLVDDSRGVLARLGRARLLAFLRNAVEVHPEWLSEVGARAGELVTPANTDRWAVVLERFGPAAVTSVAAELERVDPMRHRDRFGALWNLLVRLSDGPLRPEALRAGSRLLETIPCFPNRERLFVPLARARPGAFEDAVRHGWLSEDAIEKVAWMFDRDDLALADVFLEAGYDRVACDVITEADPPAPRYLPDLERMAAAGESATVIAAARAIEGVGVAGLPLARRLLRHTDTEVRQSTVWALTSLGEPARPLWPEALALLSSQPSPMETNAVGRLAEELGREQDVLDALRARLDAGTVTRADLDALLALGPAASDAMTRAAPELLRAADPGVREFAVIAIECTVGVPETGLAPLLGEALVDPDPAVRRTARELFGRAARPATWMLHVQQAVRELTESRPLTEESWAELDHLLTRATNRCDGERPVVRVPREVLRLLLDRDRLEGLDGVLTTALEQGAITAQEFFAKAASSPSWRQDALEILKSTISFVGPSMVGGLRAWMGPPSRDTPDWPRPADRARLFELLYCVVEESEQAAFIAPYLHDGHPEIRARAIRWTFGRQRFLDDEPQVNRPEPDLPLLLRRLETGSPAEFDAVLDVLSRLGPDADPAIPALTRLAPLLPEVARVLGALGRPGFDAAVRAVADRPDDVRHRVLDAVLAELRERWEYRKPTPELASICRDWLRARYAGPNAWARNEGTNWAIKLSGVR